MLADLDLLLTAVFCTADDLLPVAVKNARRILTDAEVVTLAWLRRSWGSPRTPRFIKIARKQLLAPVPLCRTAPAI